jgi:hypothetical protein
MTTTAEAVIGLDVGILENEDIGSAKFAAMRIISALDLDGEALDRTFVFASRAHVQQLIDLCTAVLDEIIDMELSEEETEKESV